jgi:hypothetical protein
MCLLPRPTLRRDREHLHCLKLLTLYRKFELLALSLRTVVHTYICIFRLLCTVYSFKQLYSFL